MLSIPSFFNCIEQRDANEHKYLSLFFGVKAFENAESKAKNFSFKSAPTSKLLGPMQGPK